MDEQAPQRRLLSAGVTRRRVIVEKSSDGRNRWKPDDYRMVCRRLGIRNEVGVYSSTLILAERNRVP